MFTRFETREQWLTEAVEQLGQLFEAATGETVPPVRVSVGWPGGRSAGKGNAVIGQCWHKAAAKDGRAHIFVSPILDEAPRVLDVLAHELVHAIDENESGHKGRFARLAKAIGLTGPMTATVAGDDLKADLTRLVSWRLGTYPHGALASTGRIVRTGPDGLPIPGLPGVPGGGASHPKQTTRMLKAECPCDEADPYIVRITRKQFDRGAPKCGLCGESMSLA
jgi:hypothetical protein